MVRTLISLSEADKRWLDSYSKRRGTSSAQTVREAIRRLREQDSDREKLDILAHTAGIWSGNVEAAVDYINRLRDEW